MWSYSHLTSIFGAAFFISLALNAHQYAQSQAPAPAPVVSTNVDVKPVTVHKTEHAVIKPAIHRTVSRPRIKANRAAAQVPVRKHISTHRAGKIHASGKAKVYKPVQKHSPIVLSKQKLNQAYFDCTAIPQIAYQYPRAVVINAAAEYLPKSSLLKLSYCLNKGGTG